MTDFALRTAFSIRRNFTTQTSRKVSDTYLIEMNHSLTVFLDAQNFLFLFFFGWKKNCNSKSSSNSNSGTRCPTRGFRIPDLSIKGSRKLIKWVSFFLFILMTYHSILSFLREMYVNNRLLFVGSLAHKMTYIRFHTHPEYTIMTS